MSDPKTIITPVDRYYFVRQGEKAALYDKRDDGQPGHLACEIPPAAPSPGLSAEELKVWLKWQIEAIDDAIETGEDFTAGQLGACFTARDNFAGLLALLDAPPAETKCRNCGGTGKVDGGWPCPVCATTDPAPPAPCVTDDRLTVHLGGEPITRILDIKNTLSQYIGDETIFSLEWIGNNELNLHLREVGGEEELIRRLEILRSNCAEDYHPDVPAKLKVKEKTDA